MKSEEKNWKFGNWPPPTIREGRVPVKDLPLSDLDLKKDTPYLIRSQLIKIRQITNITYIKDSCLKCLLAAFRSYSYWDSRGACKSRWTNIATADISGANAGYLKFIPKVLDCMKIWSV